MTFTKRLRDRVRTGEITCSVRIWHRPRVLVGNRYPMEEGHIQVDSITPISLPDITAELARASGFLGVIDLLKVAKHGSGNNIYLVRFHYVPPARRKAASRSEAEQNRPRLLLWKILSSPQRAQLTQNEINRAVIEVMVRSL